MSDAPSGRDLSSLVVRGKNTMLACLRCPSPTAIRVAMMRSFFPALLACLVLTTPFRADESLTFERHVRPILKANCWVCHGDKAKPKGGLDLRLVRFMN